MGKTGHVSISAMRAIRLSPLFLAAIIALLAGAAYAACTGTPTLGCDTFTHDTLGCSIKPPGCIVAPVEDCTTGCYCADAGATTFSCSDQIFQNDPALCASVPGCTWGGTLSSTTCTPIPPTYRPPPPQIGVGGGAGNIIANITALEGGTGLIGSTSGIYGVGWFNNWTNAGITGVAISVIIIALAAIVGHGFNLPEVKAFVNSELNQAIISVLLIASLILLVAFLDQTAHTAIDSMGLPLTCTSSEPCYVTAAKHYLDTLYSTGDSYAQNELTESVKLQSSASRGIATQLNFWFLLFAGTNIRLNAGLSIPAERAGTIFETTTKMMASIYAQKYFIDVVSYGIAPILLLLGIVLRTFFFTRKLGGLLLAIAISLFIIYPLTYAFAWFTLNVTVYGDRAFDAKTDPYCPSECTARYPVAYFINASSGGVVMFDSTQDIIESGITTGNWNGGGPTGQFTHLTACSNLSRINITAPTTCGLSCPDYCREVPFPSNMPGCNVTACALCDSNCKIIRQRSDCFQQNVCSLASCPLTCRTKAPVENKCFLDYANTPPSPPSIVPAQPLQTCQGCDTCPNWCKFLRLNSSGQLEHMYPNEPACSKPSCYPSSLQVPNTAQYGTCNENCFYITEIGKSSDCNELCTDPVSQQVCPSYCRVDVLANGSWVSRYDVNITVGEPNSVYDLCNSDPNIRRACSVCPSTCKLEVTAPQLGCAAWPENNYVSQDCADCPEYCRFTDFSFIPPDSNIQIDPATGLPQACRRGIGGRLNCATTGTPPACDATCMGTGNPPVCLPYDASNPIDTFCSKCPSEVRMTLSYTEASTGTVLYSGPPMIEPSFSCADFNCASNCKTPLTLPNEAISAYCKPEGAHANETVLPIYQDDPSLVGLTACPYACRLTGINPFLDSSCLANPACSLMAPVCKKSAAGGGVTPACTFLGPSPTSCIAENRHSCTNSTSGIIYDDVLFCPGQTECLGLACDNYTDFVCAPNGPRFTGPFAQTDCESGCGTYSCSTSGREYSDPTLCQSECVDPSTPVCFSSGLFDGKCNPFARWWCYNSTSGANYTGIGNCTSAAASAACTSTGLACNDYSSYSCSNNGWNNYSSQSDCRYGINGSSTLLGPSRCPQANAFSCSLTGALSEGPTALADCTGTCTCPNPPCNTAISTNAICLPYLGNGNPASPNENICYGADPLCSGLDYTSCHSLEGCEWLLNTSIKIAIDDRQIPFDNRSACQQCPEICRIENYSGDCGASNNSGYKYTDCSSASCPNICRFAQPTGGVCGIFHPFNEPCENCAALCRWQDGAPIQCASIAACAPISAGSSYGCTQECSLPAPPSKVCENCNDCPLDCTYIPATRTDCAEVCSDEALAGPANIAPDDFVKSLPGAAGSLDTKGVGTLMVPALVLPLFCIVMVIAFIRIFSPTLGGDIEIPGLGRII